MLSKTELEFLEGKKKCSQGYARFLRHSIKSKLRNFEQNVLPVLRSNEATQEWLAKIVRETSNSVREISNAPQDSKTPKNSFFSGDLGGPGGTRTHDHRLVKAAS